MTVDAGIRFKGNCYRRTIDVPRNVSRWAKLEDTSGPFHRLTSNGSLPRNWITKLIKEPLVFRFHSFAADRRRDLCGDLPRQRPLVQEDAWFRACPTDRDSYSYIFLWSFGPRFAPRTRDFLQRWSGRRMWRCATKLIKTKESSRRWSRALIKISAANRETAGQVEERQSERRRSWKILKRKVKTGATRTGSRGEQQRG